MVSSAEQQFREAASIARASGLDELTLQSMVTEAYNAPQVNDAEPAPTAEVIYDELPEGLIDLPSACRKYGVNRHTANGWMRRGMLPRKGRTRAPGGQLSVTDEAAFRQLAAQPVNVGGRPRKT